MDCDAYADLGLAALPRLAWLNGAPSISCNYKMLPSGVPFTFGGHRTEEFYVNATFRAVGGQLVAPMSPAETWSCKVIEILALGLRELPGGYKLVGFTT